MDVTTTAGIKLAAAVPTSKIFINGVQISRAVVAQEMQNHPAQKPSESWELAARALAIRELLLQRGRALGLTPTLLTDCNGRRETDDEALVRSVVEYEVRTPEPELASCRRYYEHNKHRFRSPDLYEVDHILISAAPNDTAGRAAAKMQSEALIVVLEQAPETMAKLARAHSACPSRDIGGSLGQIGPGQTVPEFETALPTIPVGTVGREPVESRYGYHVVRVNRRHDGQQLSFELVAPKITDHLRDRVHNTAICQYISALADKADITGVVLHPYNSPLNQ